MNNPGSYKSVSFPACCHRSGDRHPVTEVPLFTFDFLSTSLFNNPISAESMTDSEPAKMANDNSPGAKPPKRKAPDASKSKVTHFTSRNPPWTYLKLRLYAAAIVLSSCEIISANTINTRIPQPGTSPQPLDALSARTYLSAALSQFLGLTGTAIPIDILKIENELPDMNAQSTSMAQSDNPKKCDTVWVRVPRGDAAAVVAALSSWVGGSSGGSSAVSVAWRICAKGNFLGALVAGSGRDLFVP